jgi:hypothetical protein
LGSSNGDKQLPSKTHNQRLSRDPEQKAPWQCAGVYCAGTDVQNLAVAAFKLLRFAQDKITRHLFSMSYLVCFLSLSAK